MVYMLITTLLKLSYAWFELQKTRQRIAVIEKENIRSQSRFNDDNAYISLKSDRKIHRLDINDIFHLKAVGDYVQVFFNEKSIQVHSTLQNLLGQMPSKQFVRVHRSHAIAVNKVQTIDRKQVKVRGENIPIGQQYRTEFLNMMS
jgi:DNA-binding LytR/AlgR family response regulator